ncbi:PKD-like family protein [Chitinophaga jiangningensis]|uniref:PKD-like family protein n=1 Tax=Chitinophaga jiangningensis TaxID=1419482 RepID=A0A1M7LQU7_9BACT|nr:PKD-like family lipoprotein [Chitinophaga jiangningensis]SHM80627.1 PKD-like family protein [Chitinophaga jiangningensis]
MKRINIFIGLLGLLAIGCTKDKSTGVTQQLPAFDVAGVPDTINLYTHQDTLRLSPAVASENTYDYYWTNISANFVSLYGNRNKTDTLAFTKNLELPVKLDPGQYYLIFNVKDKRTGVVKGKEIIFNVSTRNENGWYLIKDNNGKTDVDFIYKTGRIDNWIAFNNGKSLDGNAVKGLFSGELRTTLTSPDLFGGLVVLSENDAAIYRVSNGAQVYGFDSMFFSKPANRNPQNVFQPMPSGNLMLINDNKAYCMTKGALFTNLPQTYTPSPLAVVGAMDLGWDIKTKSIFCYNGAAYAALAKNGDNLKNMTADLLWMGGYPGPRSVALTLFRLPDQRGMLYKLNTLYGFLLGSDSLIMKRDTLAPTHGLMKASKIAGNYDSDYIYYAVGNAIYLTDVTTATERLQVTLPEGEVVTDIQHIKYPVPATNVVYTTDYLAIATYKDGRYKVWLHKISSIGTIQPLAQPSFEGTGRINTIIYMEKGVGSRVF